MTVTEELIKEIVAEIAAIKQAAKDKSLDRYSLDALYQRQALLQKKLTGLLQKTGLSLSETEADKIYEELRLQKKSKLESGFKKGSIGFVLAGLVLAVGLYFAFKQKK